MRGLRATIDPKSCTAIPGGRHCTIRRTPHSPAVLSQGICVVDFIRQSLSVNRCPHCQIANPTMPIEWQPKRTDRTDGAEPEIWAGYRCTTCGSIIVARGHNVVINHEHKIAIDEFYPPSKAAAIDIPPIARRFLQQAYDTLHAPDAAAVMAGSSVDAMLKELGYVDGSVYARIEKAVQNNVLTKGMGQWAHEVRLGSNRPRHADADRPHVSSTEARQSVEFAEALGQFLFVLTARIERGIKDATDANVSEGGNKG